jgi:hypothetical protein
MGIAFTKVDDPAFVFSFAQGGTHAQSNIDDYLTGVTMGYSIRALGDPDYVRDIQSKATSADRCRMTHLMAIGQGALRDAERKGGDLHENWRDEIHRRIISPGSPSSSIKDCV